MLESLLRIMSDNEIQGPEWLGSSWISYHLAIVPIGTFFVTWILLGFGAGAWLWWASTDELKLAGQIAPFGASIYGTVMLAGDRLFRKGWTLFRREKAIEKARGEGKEEGIEIGVKSMQDWLDEQGIPWRS